MTTAGHPNHYRTIEYTTADWTEHANCAGSDTEIFFPPRGGSPQQQLAAQRRAKEICAACPVRIQCLNYAIDNDERFGIWGGQNRQDRLKYRRRSA